MSNPFLLNSSCYEVESRLSVMEARLAYQASFLADVDTSAPESGGGLTLSLGSMNVLDARQNDHAVRINNQGTAINAIKDVLVDSGLMASS